MPSHRPHLPRRRPPSPIVWDDRPWYIVHPDPDHEIVVPGFVEAEGLALDVLELPVEQEALVLLDERRRVTAVLLDPPAEIGLSIGRTDVPGLETPFCQAIDVVVRPRVNPGAVDEDDRRCYHTLRKLLVLQGVLLLDVLLTDGDAVQSLAIACDPDPVWFDDLDLPPPTQVA